MSNDRLRNIRAAADAGPTGSPGPSTGRPAPTPPPPRGPSASRVAATPASKTPPLQSTPSKRTSSPMSGPAALVAATATLAAAAVAVWLIATGAGSDSQDTPPDSAGSAESRDSGQSAPAVPGVEASAGRGNDPLGLGLPIANIGCTDDYVVILASTGVPRDYVTTLAPALRKNADASYLRTDRSCGSFVQALDGNPLYAAYLGTFADAASACEARDRSGIGDAYVRRLSADDLRRSVCACLPSAALPNLSRAADETPTVARRQHVADVQALLYRAGHNPDSYLTGIFGPLTTEMVMALQRSAGYLDVNGRIDQPTWDELLSYC